MAIHILAVFLLSFMGCLAKSQAVSRYIDDNPGVACTGNYSITNRTCTGSDGNSYLTVATCLGAATNGDVCEMRQDAYNTAVTLSPAHGGAEGAYVTLRAYNGEAVTIGAPWTLTNVSFLQIGEVGKGLTFTGFSNTLGALRLAGTTNLGVSCTVPTPTGGTTTLTDKGSCGVRIYGNTFTDLQATCTGDKCLAIYESSGTASGRFMAYLDIRHNTITNTQLGILMLGADYSVLAQNLLHDFRDTNLGFPYKYAIKIGIGIGWIHIYNNTAYNLNFPITHPTLGGYGIWLDVDPHDAVIEKNLVYNTQGAAYIDEQAGVRNIWRYNVAWDSKNGWTGPTYYVRPMEDHQVTNNTFAGSSTSDICAINVAGTLSQVKRNILQSAKVFVLNSLAAGLVDYDENIVTEGTGNLTTYTNALTLSPSDSPDGTAMQCTQAADTTFAEFETAVGDVGTQATQTFFNTGALVPDLNLVAGSSGLAGCTGGTDCGAFKQPRISSCAVADATPTILDVIVQNTGTSLTVLTAASLAPTVNAVARGVSSATVEGSGIIRVALTGAAITAGQDVDLPMLQAAFRNDWCVGTGNNAVCSKAPAQTVQCSNTVGSAGPAPVRTQYTWQVRSAETAMHPGPDQLYGGEKGAARMRPGGRGMMLFGLAITEEDTVAETLGVACSDNGGAAYELDDASCAAHYLCLDPTSAVVNRTPVDTRPFYQAPPVASTFATPNKSFVRTAGASGAGVRLAGQDYAPGVVFRLVETATVGHTIACWLRLADGTPLNVYTPAQGTPVLVVSGPFGYGP